MHLSSTKLGESLQTFEQIQILFGECDHHVEDDVQSSSSSLNFLRSPTNTDASVYQSALLTSQSHTPSFDLSAWPFVCVCMCVCVPICVWAPICRLPHIPASPAPQATRPAATAHIQHSHPFFKAVRGRLCAQRLEPRKKTEMPISFNLTLIFNFGEGGEKNSMAIFKGVPRLLISRFLNENGFYEHTHVSPSQSCPFYDNPMQILQKTCFFLYAVKNVLFSPILKIVYLNISAFLGSLNRLLELTV